MKPSSISEHKFIKITPTICPRCGGKAEYDENIFCSRLPAAGNGGEMTCTKCGFVVLFINEGGISTHYCKHCDSVFYNKSDKWLKKPETETKQKVTQDYGKHKFIKIVPTVCPRCGAAAKYDRHMVEIPDTDFCSYIKEAQAEFAQREGEGANLGKMVCSKCGFTINFIKELGISTYYCKHCDSVFYNMFGEWEKVSKSRISDQRPHQ